MVCRGFSFYQGTVEGTVKSVLVSTGRISLIDWAMPVIPDH